jgi:hypothetical protein
MWPGGRWLSPVVGVDRAQLVRTSGSFTGPMTREIDERSPVEHALSSAPAFLHALPIATLGKLLRREAI